MPATLKLSASLRSLVGGKDIVLVESGSSVRETIVLIGIKPEIVAMVSVNGELQNKDYVIQEGDMIMLLAVVGGG